MRWSRIHLLPELSFPAASSRFLLSSNFAAYTRFDLFLLFVAGKICCWQLLLRVLLSISPALSILRYKHLLISISYLYLRFRRECRLNNDLSPSLLLDKNAQHYHFQNSWLKFVFWCWRLLQTDAGDCKRFHRFSLYTSPFELACWVRQMMFTFYM